MDIHIYIYLYELRLIKLTVFSEAGLCGFFVKLCLSITDFMLKIYIFYKCFHVISLGSKEKECERSRKLSESYYIYWPARTTSQSNGYIYTFIPGACKFIEFTTAGEDNESNFCIA